MSECVRIRSYYIGRRQEDVYSNPVRMQVALTMAIYPVTDSTMYFKFVQLIMRKVGKSLLP